MLLFTKMKKLVIGGLAFFLGCNSGPSPAEKALEEIIGKLTPLIAFHNGLIATVHERDDIAAQDYTRAIERADNGLYRMGRYKANLQRALKLKPEEREPLINLCLIDAHKYTEFLPESPDGYAAKSAAYMALPNEGENQKHAFDYLEDALLLIEQGKKIKFFDETSLRRMYWQWKQSHVMK